MCLQGVSHVTTKFRRHCTAETLINTDLIMKYNHLQKLFIFGCHGNKSEKCLFLNLCESLPYSMLWFGVWIRAKIICMPL